MPRLDYFSYIENFSSTVEDNFLFETGSFPEPDSGWTCRIGLSTYQDPSSSDYDEDKLKTDLKQAAENYQQLIDDYNDNKLSAAQVDVLNKLWEGYCYSAEGTEDGYFTGEGVLGCYNAYGVKIPDCACDYHCFPNTFGCADIISGSVGEPDTLEMKAVQCKCANENNEQVNCFDMCGRWGGPNTNTDGCCDPNASSDKCYIAQSSNTDESDDYDKIAGTTCPQPTLSQNASNVTDLADAMGMNQTCVSDQTEVADSGQMAGGLVGVLGVGGMEESYTSTFNDTSASGCAQRSLNIAQNNQNVNNITCSISNLKQTQSVDIFNDSVLNVTFKSPTQDQLDAQTAAINRAYDSQDRWIQAYALAPNKYTNTQVETFTKLFEDEIDLAETMLTNMVTNSTFQANAETTLSQSLTSDQQSATEMISQSISKITATVSDNLVNNFDLGSLQPNTSDVIDSEVSNNLSNISAGIINAIQEQVVSTNTGATINLYFNAGTKIDNDTFTAGSKVDLVQNAIAKMENEISDSITNSITADAVGDYSSDNTSTGVSQIVDSLGKANASALSAVSGFWSSWIFIIIGACVLLGLFGVLLHHHHPK